MNGDFENAVENGILFQNKILSVSESPMSNQNKHLKAETSKSG